MPSVEKWTYIKIINTNGESHRRGAIMFAPIDDVMYVSASLCCPDDKFNRERALGLARGRIARAYHDVHLKMNDPLSKKCLIVHTSGATSALSIFDMDKILKYTGIIIPYKKYYMYAVDIGSLKDHMKHELNGYIL